MGHPTIALVKMFEETFPDPWNPRNFGFFVSLGNVTFLEFRTYRSGYQIVSIEDCTVTSGGPSNDLLEAISKSVMFNSILESNHSIDTENKSPRFYKQSWVLSGAGFNTRVVHLERWPQNSLQRRRGKIYLCQRSNEPHVCYILVLQILLAYISVRNRLFNAFMVAGVVGHYPYVDFWSPKSLIFFPIALEFFPKHWSFEDLESANTPSAGSFTAEMQRKMSFEINLATITTGSLSLSLKILEFFRKC